MSHVKEKNMLYWVRSGQASGHTPEHHIAASTLRRHSFGLRLAIVQAHARPTKPISLRLLVRHLTQL